jgi:hypothetical protein
MAPEVRGGGESNAKSEIFSLGLLMWTLSSLELPLAELGLKIFILFYFIF